MKKNRWIIFLTLFVLFINSSLFFVYAKAAMETPRLDGDVNARNVEITMPINGDPAKGSVGLSVIPKGSTTQIGRSPVDLVFVIDRSGSMGDTNVGGSKVKDENGNWTTRMELAKKAIRQAVDMLKQDNPSGSFDRIGLVSFSSTATIDAGLTDNTNNAFENIIMKKVNGLAASGGTNYSDALEKANQVLASSRNSKYIIFLTDGDPTQFSKSNVNLKGKYYYLSGKKKIDAPQGALYTVSMTIYTNGTVSETVSDQNGRNYYPYDSSLRAVTERIRAYALDSAGQVAAANTKLYSVGFELDDTDLDFLQNISQTTGGTAVRGTTQNLKETFESITKQIRELKMSEVKVKVKLNNIPGNTSNNIELTPDATAVMSGDYAVINLSDVPYKRDGSTPSPQSYSLPLIFKAVGTYELNDIKLYYKDFDNKDQVTTLPSVTVTVKSGTIPVTGVTLNKDKVTMNPGNEGQLIATVLPVNATNKAVTWSSSDANVVKVDAQGKIIAQNPGTAKVTVTTVDGNYQAYCVITVLNPLIPVTGVELQNSLTLNVNDSERLVATVKPDNASNKSVRWSSSNPLIASVDAEGNVRGMAPGNAMITVTTVDGGFTARCNVTVLLPTVPVATISLPEFLTLGITEEQSLTPVIKPLNATNKLVKWESSAPDIASVDAQGRVKGMYGGTAIITVTSLENSSIKAECKVTVKMKPEFHGKYQVVGDEGKLEVNHQGALANTITDKTEWYRWDRDENKWVKFETGKFKDNIATITVRLDKNSSGSPLPTTFGLKAVTPGFPGREVVGENAQFPITFTPDSINLADYIDINLSKTGTSGDNKAVKLGLSYKISKQPSSYLLKVTKVSYVLKPKGDNKGELAGTIPPEKEGEPVYRWVKPTSGKTTTYEAVFTIQVDFLHPETKKRIFTDSITPTSPPITIKGTERLK